MRRDVPALVAVATAGLVAVHRRVLGIERRPSWPPPGGAVTADGAQAATEAFATRDSPRPHDAALDFAWSTAATLEPWVDGEHFFPRILADVAAAITSEADRRAVCAISVGSRGLGRVTAPLLGSTSQALLRHTRHPVLVVRAPE